MTSGFFLGCIRSLSILKITMFPSALLAVFTPINHLLTSEAWAREKLKAHAGKVACMDGGVVCLRAKVTPDGLLESDYAADVEGSVANVTIKFAWSDLPLMLQNRERAFSYVKIEGDADFANTISQISNSLRWEAEHDLARWIGDIAAVRVVSHAKSAWQAGRAQQQKLTENVAEYLLEENPMLVRLQEMSDVASEITRTRDDVERLLKRIEKLEKLEKL